MRTLFKDYSLEMNTKECPECDGKGCYEVLNCSASSSSDCCGGCYVDKECDYCDGSGKKFQDDLLAFKRDRFQKNRFKRNYDAKYWKLSCGMSLDKLQRIILPDRSLLMFFWYNLKKK